MADSATDMPLPAAFPGLRTVDMAVPAPDPVLPVVNMVVLPVMNIMILPALDMGEALSE
jgi:hypothetical protein